MIKLFKFLFGAFFIAYVAFITWGNLPLPQKHWVFDKLGISFDRTSPTLNSDNEDGNLERLIGIKETISNLIDDNAPQALQGVIQTFEQHAIPSLCLKTTTRAVTTVDKTNIYRWTDKNGQVHFSDSKPKQQASHEVTDHYALDKQFFRMNLTSPEHGLPTLLGEQLQRDVNAIYGYLSDRMAPQYLRQVDLNLKVFNTLKGFEEYRKIHAPTLSSVAGFYTSINNEAVVMQQAYDQQTRAIARHEATHVINAGLFGHSPIWFNEGLSEYFESYTYAELKTGLTPANKYHLNFLSSQLRSRQLPSLHEYLLLSESEWRSLDQRTMYAMAWSIIYLLQDHHEGEQFTRRLLTQMAENPCTALDAIKIWQEAYPGGLAAFEQRWRSMLLNNL